MNNLKIYCIGYAGYKAAIFNRWISKEYEIIPLELSGRGIKKSDSHYESVLDAITELGEEIDANNRQNAKEPFVILGHSAGAIMAYGIVQWLEINKKILPKKLIVIGMEPENYLEENVKDMDFDDFIDMISEIGYLPNEIIQRKELCRLFIGDIRQDILMIQQYRLETKISVGILAVSGDRENMTKEIQKWKQYTEGGFNNIMYEGDHFSLFDDDKVIKAIVDFVKGEKVYE